MDANLSGQAVFERIRRDIVSCVAPWVEREVERGPYDLQPSRQRAVDEDDEVEEPGGWSASHIAP
jgi:hypothetical protein